MTKIGIIAGTFDVMHPGYIKMFSDAKEFVCDKTLVLLNSGKNMIQYDKPDLICSLQERRDRLYALRHVDEVVTYDDEKELYLILKNSLEENDNDKEYVRILGSDYIDKPFTGDDLALEVFYIERDHDWSTTKYKRLIAEKYYAY